MKLNSLTLICMHLYYSESDTTHKVRNHMLKLASKELWNQQIDVF